MQKHTYANLIYWDDTKGWTATSKKDFINKNYSALSTRLSTLNNKDTRYKIYQEYYHSIPDNMEAAFEKYSDNCGN